MPKDTRHLISYDRFVIDRNALEIRDAAGAHVPVGPQGVRLLILLHDHLDQVVTRGDIYEALWPDSEADVNRGLNTLVRQIRIGLGDTATEPRYIRTYQARGYRLLPVRAPEVASASEAAQESGSAPLTDGTEAHHEALVAVIQNAPVERGARWWPRLRVPVAAAAGVAFLYSMAHAHVLPGRSAITVHVAGVPSAERAAWKESLGREAGRRAMRPEVVFFEAAGSAPALFVTCEAEGDTVWSASLDVVSAAERDALVVEALAVARSNPDVGRTLPAVSLLSDEQGALVARARHFLWRADPRDRRQAAPLLERALLGGARAPGLVAEFAEALFHAGALDSAARVARRSVEEEPTIAAGWFMAGVTAHLVDWDWPRAERQVARAIQLDPGVARFHSGLAFIRVTAGERTGAREALARVIRTGAEDALTAADLGHILNLMGDHAAAARYCEQSLELADLPATRGCVVSAYLAAGDTSAARRMLGSDAGGDIARWRAARADRAIREARRTDEGWYVAAEALATDGREVEALEALARAVQQHEPWAVMALVSPTLSHLATAPRWQEVVSPLAERVERASNRTGSLADSL